MDHFYILRRIILKRGTKWNKLQAPKSSYKKRAGATWNELELPEKMWSHLGQDEPSNKLTQKQEVHSTKLCLQTLLSEEMKPPETKWSQ